MQKPNLSVIGLGKLGAPLVAIFGAKGFSVVGVDLNKKHVDLINQAQPPVYEPRLAEYLAAGKNNIRATQDYSEAIGASEITFLIVPTPSKEDGNFSDEHLKAVLKSLAETLKASKKEFHTFVIVSTVSPGTIDKSLIPWIEEHSGRKFNEGFGVAYNPEFIALGDVINGLLRPDMVLIGEGSKEVGDRLAEMYGHICENNAYIARMSIISAEIAKISLNAFITMKISYANTLANICEKIPGANIDDITRAIGADKRVSPHYLKGGLSFGGPCFPRDSRAFAVFAKNYGVDARLATATDEINKLQIPNLILKIQENAGEDKTVSILGLAYKPDTPVVEESPSVSLIEGLLKNGLKITVYDPLAMENARATFKDQIKYSSSAREALVSSSLAVIATQDKEFKALGPDDMPKNLKVLIDCWRILETLKSNGKVRYISLGKDNDTDGGA